MNQTTTVRSADRFVKARSVPAHEAVRTGKETTMAVISRDEIFEKMKDVLYLIMEIYLIVLFLLNLST